MRAIYLLSECVNVNVYVCFHCSVCYLNMELAPPTTDDGYCHVDIFDSPGVTTHDESSKPGNLVQLTQQYVNEVFHNVYCHRLFIWEQVSSHWFVCPRA